MAIKLVDELKAMGNFPIAHAEGINLVKTDGTEDNLQNLFDNGELIGGGGDSSVTLTQQEYEALSEEEKLDGLYYTYDTKRIYKNGVQYGASDAEDIGYNNAKSGIQATTVQGAIDKVVKTVEDNYAKTTDIPTTLPANGGNADTVNNHTVKSDVPENAVFTDTIYDDTEVKGSIAELNDSLVDKQDFRIFKSLEEFNEKKGTSFTVVSGVDNMVDIANAMSEGDMLIITTKYNTGSEIYFELDSSTGWTKIFTFIKANGLCDVECRTTSPSTFKRVLNVDGVIGTWQEIATMDKISPIPIEANRTITFSNDYTEISVYRCGYSNIRAHIEIDALCNITSVGGWVQDMGIVLPEGYRPYENMSIPAWCSSDTEYHMPITLMVGADGKLSGYIGGSHTSINRLNITVTYFK